MKFAKYAREGVSPRSRKALLAALRNIKRSLRQHDIQIDKILDDPRLSKKSKRFIQDLWYGDPAGQALSLGNRRVHRAANIAAIIVMLCQAQIDKQARRGRLRLRMLTAAPDLGICRFDAPHQDIGSVGRHFDQACRRARVDGLGFIDIAVVVDRTSLESPSIAFHMHGAIRATDRSFRTKVAQRLASPRSRPHNKLGLRVIKITAKGRDWGERINRDQIAGLGYYIAKRSCGLKVLVSDAGRRAAKTTLAGWTRGQALRQLECYSHCDVLCTTRGVGAGSKWRAQWKSVLLRLLRIRGSVRGLKIDHGALQRQWSRVWSELAIPGMTALRFVAP